MNLLRHFIAVLVETGWITAAEYDQVYNELRQITGRDVNLRDVDKAIANAKADR
jgi:hypothetical protein